MKKKPQGHYCRICGQYKANEKFSGRGHAAHICKACNSLPAARRNELTRINEIERISENFFISREKLERLKKIAGDKRYPGAREYAREALNDFRLRMDEYNRDAAADDEISETLTPVTYSELSDELKEEARSRLEELIAYFIDEAGHTPEEISPEEILPMFCEEFCDVLDEEPKDRILVPDGAMISLYNEILGKVMERKI